MYLSDTKPVKKGSGGFGLVNNDNLLVYLFYDILIF